MNKDKLIILSVLVTLGLTIALNATIVSKDSCNTIQGQFTEMTWGLAVGTICAWVISLVCVANKTGLGFQFQKIFQSSSEYLLLTFFGSLLLPCMILAEDKGNHSGDIDSTMNNIAVVGLVLSSWIVIGTVMKIMFDKKLYNMATKTIGLSKSYIK